jgi:hypothetical protein
LPDAEQEIRLAAAACEEHRSATMAWRYLPAETAVYGIERLPNGRTGVLARDSKVGWRWKIIRAGRVEEEVTGPKALSALREASRQKAIRFSTEKLRFAHVSAEEGNLVFQVGNERVSVSVLDWYRWVANPSSVTFAALEGVFATAARKGQDIVLLRDALAARPERFGGSFVQGGVDDPIKVAVLLKERFPEARIRIDDAPEEVAARLASIKPVEQPEDLGLAIPPGEARVEDHGLIDKIKKVMVDAGVKTIEKPADLAHIANILVISAHNDEQLFNYIESLGKHRIAGRSALKGKLLLLNTCFEPGNSNMVHELIERYELAGVYYPTEVIDMKALHPVMLAVRDILREVKRQGKKLHPEDLLRQAGDRVLKDIRDKANWDEVRKIKKGVLQISRRNRSDTHWG